MKPLIYFSLLARDVAIGVGSIFLIQGAAYSAATDLANGPLANGVSSATVVKPNIAFIVDDSGSMEDENMPGDNGTNRSNNCWGWKKYNTLAYDPTRTYKPPYLPSELGGVLYSDGVYRYPDASFTAAKFDGYYGVPGYTYGGNSTSNYTVDLSVTANLRTTATTKYYYTYVPTSAPSSEQNSTACLANNKYTAVTDAANIQAPGQTTGSAAAKTNYANWFSYYRKRAYLMKASTAEAFSDLSDQYRLGLFFIGSAESGADGSASEKVNNDLKVDDFSGTHRTTFFDRLLKNRSAGWTPLRGALARMGRMYAGQFSGWDPVQYSCQQNFAILSTDGYWNTDWESSTYTNLTIDGSALIGNVDGSGAAAVAARAKIAIGNRSGNPCYWATSVTVDTGTSTVELLASSPAPAVCSTGADDLGNGIAAAINNKTGTTGFSATYSNGTNELTIIAPTSLGNFTGTPVATFVNTASGGSRSFTTTAFSGGSAAGSTTPLPYRDTLNKSGTLADIAYYYYTNDLRTSALGNCTNTIGSTTYTNLCENNVTGSGRDVNQQQHMTTYTIGLGANGTLLYEPNYETAPKDSDSATTQYYDIANGTSNWPDPIANSGGQRIDDLWHAAVNGRGYYYSARTADELSSGIRSALAGIQARLGSSSAAATSNLEPVAGDNFVYVALYRTQAWDGDLRSYTIDPQTGQISGAHLWSGQSMLDSQVAAAGAGADARTIKYFSSGGANKLKDFTQVNLTADSKIAGFENFCSKSPQPDQCGSDGDDLNATQVGLANNSDNLIKYLRGQATYEDDSNVGNPLYRGREHVLGDVINAIPVYLKAPPFTYDQYDGTYATFKTNNASRAGTVFVAANDGMLHAFNADTGAERWAYVPSFVMPNMWRLADRAYGNNHRYLVDGSPTVADVCSSSTATAACSAVGDWKTIIVGGLNKGGCGYYALDVTDPTAPKGLWEFSHEQLGYTYGNPIVTRRKSDGKWVVIFASGYNNTPTGGCPSATAASDGNGHVFVLDALTGALLDRIPTYTTGTTPAGTPSTPSGLAKLNAWIDNGDVNIAFRLYGGDLLGNFWRIDYDDQYSPSGKEAVRIAELKTAANTPQPVTTKPELNVIKSAGSYYDVAFVATGRYLGVSDPADTSQNTLYAIKDQQGSSPNTPRASAVPDVRGVTMLSRTLTQGTNSSLQTIRTVSGTAMDWATKDGWYLDFNPSNLSPGERVNTDMQLYFTSLIMATNVPDTNVCNVGGYAWVYFLNTQKGLNVDGATDNMAALRLDGNALVAGIKTVKLQNGKTVTIVTDTAGGLHSVSNPGTATNVKMWRTTWREIPN